LNYIHFVFAPIVLSDKNNLSQPVFLPFTAQAGHALPLIIAEKRSLFNFYLLSGKTLACFLQPIPEKYPSAGRHFHTSLLLYDFSQKKSIDKL